MPKRANIYDARTKMPHKPSYQADFFPLNWPLALPNLLIVCTVWQKLEKNQQSKTPFFVVHCNDLKWRTAWYTNIDCKKNQDIFMKYKYL